MGSERGLQVMSNNNKDERLIVTAVKKGSQIIITFGSEVSPQLASYALRLMNLQLDNKIIGADKPKPQVMPQAGLPLGIPQVIQPGQLGSIINRIRGK